MGHHYASAGWVPTSGLEARGLNQTLMRKGTRVESFEKLKKLIVEAEDDVKKAEGGNKAAGTRARQTMQDIKNAAQEVREKILELRNAGEPNNQ